MIQERSQLPIRDCFERVPLGLTVERDFYLTDAAALLFRRGKRRKGKGGKKKKKSEWADGSKQSWTISSPSSGPLGPFSRKVRSFTPTRASEKVRDRLVYTNKFTQRDERRGSLRG